MIPNHPMHALRRSAPDFQHMYRQLSDHVRALAEEDLAKLFRIGRASTPVKLHTMIAWRYKHWQEHTRHIRTWLKAQQHVDRFRST